MFVVPDLDLRSTLGYSFDLESHLPGYRRRYFRQLQPLVRWQPEFLDRANKYEYYD